MDLQDFIRQIDNYDHLTPIGKKAVDIYCLELTDKVNKSDNEDLSQTTVCSQCGGLGCALCNNGVVKLSNQINEAIFYYMEKILINEFERISDIDCIFHPLVVKTSLSKERYDMLFRNLLGLEYTEYVAKIKYGNTTREARNNYVLNNLTTVDYENTLEVGLCDRFLTYLLEEKKELTADEDKWLIRYISAKKAHKMNAKIDLTILSIKKFIKQEKISLLKPFSLKKVSKLFNDLGSEKLSFNKGQVVYRVMVNPLGIYLSDFSQKKIDTITQMFITSYHEMRHVYQDQMIEENKMPNFEVLLWAREGVIHEEYEEYYDTNYSAMTIERDARIASREQTLIALKKYSPKSYALKKDQLTEEIEDDRLVKDLSAHHFLNFKDTRDNMTRKMVDVIIKEKPSYIEQFPTLKREYNTDGTRKDISQLLLDEKEFRNEMKNYQEELYHEHVTDREFKMVQDLLNQALNEGIRFFDELIYLSLEKKDQQYISDTCNKLYVDDMRRVEAAISHKINTSAISKIELLELFKQNRIKQKTWLLIDTIINGQYAEGINIQKQILGHIKDRNAKLQDVAVPTEGIKSR